MRVLSNKGSVFKNLLLFILLVAVIVQGYLLWKPVKPLFSLPNFFLQAQEGINSFKPPQELDVEGYLAIVLDDWGYNTHNCSYLEKIDAPLSIAILPNLRHSKDIVECAQRSNKEIMLHLPMQPHFTSDEYPEGYVIKTTMSERTIKETLNTILDRMPEVKGVNNHMGSLATETDHVMEAVLDVIKKRKLFFLDSVVTSKSIAETVAKKKKVPFTRRDVFLDNQNTRAYIKKQLEMALRKAKHEGFALAIGHDRKLTLQVIKERIPHIKEEGIRIITVQEYIQRTK